jgi:hypothetical protein
LIFLHKGAAGGDWGKPDTRRTEIAGPLPALTLLIRTGLPEYCRKLKNFYYFSSTSFVLQKKTASAPGRNGLFQEK